MLSIVYDINGNIKEYHEYLGKPRRFSGLNQSDNVWHVPQAQEQAITRRHNMVILDDGVPIGADFSGIRKERIRGVAVQTGGLWELPNKEPYHNQNMVLVARFKGIGDVLMTWFAIEEYRIQYPDRHITYLTSPQSAALFCGQTGLVDKVMYTKYDHDAKPGPVSLPITTKQYSYVYNIINMVDFGQVAYTKARADNFGDLLGIDMEKHASYNPETGIYIPDIPVRELQVNPEEVRKAKELIHWGMNDRIITMVLDSNGKPRKWFYWNELAKKCIKAGYKVVYISTDPAHVTMKIPKSVINLACKTTVREYIAVLAVSNLLVCVDSSALHIGARLSNLKVIPLFGSTGAWAHTKYYQNVYPIQGIANCYPPPPCWDWQISCCDMEKDRLKCMRNISADMVMDKIKEIEG